MTSVATISCLQRDPRWCSVADTSACTGTTPVCGSDSVCHACSAHSDCASNACLPDGSCGDDTNVAYASSSGTNTTMCTLAMPCATIAMALATNRPNVKLSGTFNEAVNVKRSATFLADVGTTISAPSGVIFEVNGAPQVSLYDVTLLGTSGLSNSGILLQAGQLDVERIKVTGCVVAGILVDAGTFVASQSVLENNPGGGVWITNASFDITNTLVVGNGSASAVFGGVRLDQIPASGAHRLDFNTIAANSAGSGTAAGIVCGSMATPAVFSDDIVYGNGSASTPQITASTTCSTTYSDVGPIAATGSDDLDADPMFANPSQGDYHLTANSPCRHAADPNATINVDLDGNPRTNPADIGAYEYP